MKKLISEIISDSNKSVFWSTVIAAFLNGLISIIIGVVLTIILTKHFDKQMFYRNKEQKILELKIEAYQKYSFSTNNYIQLLNGYDEFYYERNKIGNNFNIDSFLKTNPKNVTKTLLSKIGSEIIDKKNKAFNYQPEYNTNSKQAFLIFNNDTLKKCMDSLTAECSEQFYVLEARNYFSQIPVNQQDLYSDNFHSILFQRKLNRLYQVQTYMIKEIKEDISQKTK